jgi:hypothetical protein
MQGAEAVTFGNASLNAWCAGRVDAARERNRRALEGGQRDPFELTIPKNTTAALHLYLREPARAEALAAEAFAYSEEHGFPELALWSLMLLGGARAEVGRTGEGVALLRQAVGRTTASGYLLNTAVFTSLAQALALDGLIADALSTIDDAFRANPEELGIRPETYRIRGELRLRQDENRLAEADFREAIALAQKTSAKSWELRATLSLARLLRDTNRRDEASAMLAENYEWFSDGFDTADLRDANSLLDELNA